MLLLKESTDNFHQPVPGFPAGCCACSCSSSRRQHTHMIYSQEYHYSSQNQHDCHPCLHSRFMADSFFRPLNSSEVFQQPACQPNQSAGCNNFSDIIESTLPTDILGLILLIQFRHINTICCNIVCRPAESNNRQQSNTHGKESRKMQRQCYQGKTCPGNQLCQHHKELFRLEHFQERTPKEFQCPRQHNQ